MAKQELPKGNPTTFVGEFENMDLSELRDQEFMVAINSGRRESHMFVQNTIRGPLTFIEMVERVGKIFRDQQLHAFVMLTQKDDTKELEWLDECTVDFIEAKTDEIITAEWIGGSLDEESPYTCQAGVTNVKEYYEKMKEEEETNGEADEQDPGS